MLATQYQQSLCEWLLIGFSSIPFKYLNPTFCSEGPSFGEFEQTPPTLGVSPHIFPLLNFNPPPKKMGTTRQNISGFLGQEAWEFKIPGTPRPPTLRQQGGMTTQLDSLPFYPSYLQRVSTT